MKKYQYCSPSKGSNLLTKNTNIEWRSIQNLYPNICVATILPSNSHYSDRYPVLNQTVYVPKRSGSLISSPDRLYKYLHNSSQKALKVMPSVKYNLKGVKISMLKSIPRPDGLWVIEGAASLTGEILVKPTAGRNPLALSVNDKSGRITLAGAAQVKNDFITSLKIDACILEGKSSLTIGSSFTDKMLMTATSIQLIPESPYSIKIIATFVPKYCEVVTRFGLTLETQIGYEFSGKATRYSSPSTPHHLSTSFLAGSALIGVTILCVFAAPEVITGSAIIAGSLLIAKGV